MSAESGMRRVSTTSTWTRQPSSPARSSPTTHSALRPVMAVTCSAARLAASDADIIAGLLAAALESFAFAGAALVEPAYEVLLAFGGLLVGDLAGGDLVGDLLHLGGDAARVVQLGLGLLGERLGQPHHAAHGGQGQGHQPGEQAHVTPPGRSRRAAAARSAGS